jgi:hypothetical protein
VSRFSDEYIAITKLFRSGGPLMTALQRDASEPQGSGISPATRRRAQRIGRPLDGDEAERLWERMEGVRERQRNVWTDRARAMPPPSGRSQIAVEMIDENRERARSKYLERLEKDA